LLTEDSHPLAHSSINLIYLSHSGVCLSCSYLFYLSHLSISCICLSLSSVYLMHLSTHQIRHAFLLYASYLCCMHASHLCDTLACYTLAHSCIDLIYLSHDMIPHASLHTGVCLYIQVCVFTYRCVSLHTGVCLYIQVLPHVTMSRHVTMSCHVSISRTSSPLYTHPFAFRASFNCNLECECV